MPGHIYGVGPVFVGLPTRRSFRTCIDTGSIHGGVACLVTLPKCIPKCVSIKPIGGSPSKHIQIQFSICCVLKSNPQRVWVASFCSRSRFSLGVFMPFIKKLTSNRFPTSLSTKYLARRRPASKNDRSALFELRKVIPPHYAKPIGTIEAHSLLRGGHFNRYSLD